jgi:hypothetical protein
MIFNVTIVSAFLININNRTNSELDKYINNGKLLLEAKIPKVIFIDELIYDKFIECNNEYTRIINYNKYNSYLFNLKDKLTNFKLNTDNINKDTLDYIITMCSKTEWIRDAINLNFFNTINYIWMDFGIKYILPYTNEEFINKIENLNYRVYDNVRIASIWNLNNNINIDIYTRINWFFAGGVVGGNKEKLIIFADKMKEYCLNIIDEKKTLMWEVNVWYLIYKNNKDLFNIYYANHDKTLIELY